jgi:hypothetical protein
MVAHATWEAEAGGLQVWGQPGFYSESLASLGYVVRPCLKKQSKMKKQNTYKQKN